MSLAPIGLLILAFSEAREFVLNAPEQYQELLDYIARTVLELRLKLPPDIGAYLPEGAAEVQRIIAGYLRAQAGALALTGRAWLGGLLFAYVGLIVGALAAVAAPCRRRAARWRELLKQRITLFGEAFGQIVAAQFWIAAFNTLLTAIFLLFLLPHWELRPALHAGADHADLRRRAGADRRQPAVQHGHHAGGAVGVADHRAGLPGLPDPDPQGRVLHQCQGGGQPARRWAVWELLAVMFVAEAVFGPAGLVAAPLFYAYLKKELQAARLV